MKLAQRGSGGNVCWLLMFGVVLASQAMAQSKSPGRVTIHHEGFPGPQQRGAPLAIEATISSPAGIQEAQVFCRPQGGREFRTLPMEFRGEERYRAVVPDWMTAGEGLEYYITATDQNGRSASHGFVGFPLAVRLVSERPPTREERLETLEKTLDVIRKSRQDSGRGGGLGGLGGYNDPLQERYR